MAKSVINGISCGHTLGYTGSRVTSRLCTNPKSFGDNLSALGPIFAKDEQRLFRSGPFHTQAGLPLFKLLCSPMRAAFKKFSGKPRLVNNLSFPYDGTSVNGCIPDGAQFNISIRHVAF